MSTNASFTSSATVLQRQDVTVLRVVRETADVVTLQLERPADFAYNAGQYITVFFDDTDVPEGKAYSLSSCPEDDFLAITVKKVGLFSGKLHDLQAGEALAISPAYGMFNAFGEAPLVAIAAGVGIAPIYSIIQQEARLATKRLIHLIYTNTSEEALVFRKELEQLQQQNPNLSVQYIVTRQPESEFYAPRITGEEAMRNFKDRFVCICGTMEFVRDLRRQLVAVGLGDDDIMTEVFFEAKRE